MSDAKNLSHRYAYDFDVNDEEVAGGFVARFVGSEKRVLDVGSGPGSITRHLKEAGGCNVVAVENDPQAAAMVAPYCEKVLQCDLNSPSVYEAIRASGTYDVVVLADVLEHLYDPWRILRDLKPVLNDGGYFVVSLPNASHNAVIAALLNAEFEYQDDGLLDRTHVRFFAMRDIQALFTQAGLTIVDARFVMRDPAATGLARHWAALPGGLRRPLLRNRYGRIYQVVVKAQPVRENVRGVDLLALPVPERRLHRLERGEGTAGWRPAGALREFFRHVLTRLGPKSSGGGK